MEKITLNVPEGTSKTRLDKILADLYPELSRSRLKGLIEEGDVTVGNFVIKTPSHKVSGGEDITLTIPAAVDDTPVAENIPLDIIYEDEDLLVINKPVGMVVHPAVGNTSGTLVNALLHYCPQDLSGIGGVRRPGIVHRLDKETSGLLVVAKNDMAHQGLSAQLQDRSLSRVYGALVWRSPTIIKGSVDMPIGRHSSNRLKMAVMMKSGRAALTHYYVEKSYTSAASLIRCKLESGRTHQIRVHMQHIKFPLIGDPLYGLPNQEGKALLSRAGYDDAVINKIMAFDRQALHAQEIGFIHPRSGEEMTFTSPWPEDLLILKNHLESIS